jgi:uncharacterized Tic20 family protein
VRQGQPAPQSSDERTWGMFCHLAALAGFVGIPFGNIVGPLIVWLVKRNDYPFVDDQGKEALNFHISMLLYIAVLIGLAAALFWSALIWHGVSIVPPGASDLVLLAVIVVAAVLAGIFWLLNVILIIVAAVRASNGVAYRYPLTIRFIG